MALDKKKMLENYVPVKDRVKEFRDKHCFEYSLESELLDHDDTCCTFKAVIRSVATGAVVAVGHSHEKISDNPFVNSTSMLENCETSAWGRALANFGMSIDKGIASQEEMKRASATKPKVYSGKDDERRKLFSILRSKGINDNEMAKNIHEALMAQNILNDDLSLTRFITEFK